MRVLFNGRYYQKEETEETIRLIPEEEGLTLVFTKDKEEHERAVKELREWLISELVHKLFNS